MGNISFSFYENKPSKQVHVPVCFSKKVVGVEREKNLEAQFQLLH